MSSYNTVFITLNAGRDGFSLEQNDSLYGTLDSERNINQNKSIQPSLKTHLIKAVECKTSEAALKILKDLGTENFSPPVSYSHIRGEMRFNVTRGMLIVLVDEKIKSKKNCVVL